MVYNVYAMLSVSFLLQYRPAMVVAMAFAAIMEATKQASSDSLFGLCLLKFSSKALETFGFLSATRIYAHTTRFLSFFLSLALLNRKSGFSIQVIELRPSERAKSWVASELLLPLNLITKPQLLKAQLFNFFSFSIGGNI